MAGNIEWPHASGGAQCPACVVGLAQRERNLRHGGQRQCIDSVERFIHLVSKQLTDGLGSGNLVVCDVAGGDEPRAHIGPQQGVGREMAEGRPVLGADDAQSRIESALERRQRYGLHRQVRIGKQAACSRVYVRIRRDREPAQRAAGRCGL